MEPKKAAKADLSRKSPLFFSIGLVVSLVLVVTAFSYYFPEDGNQSRHPRVVDRFDSLILIPPTHIDPPKPPRIIQPKIVEVKNDAPIKDDPHVIFELNPDSLVQSIVIKPEEIPAENLNDIHLIAEVEPTPQGGMQAFYDYVGRHLKYPTQARRMNVEGRVFVQFVVERDGSLSDVKAIKGIGAGCDEEAVRVVQSAPAWTPGKQRGIPVRVRMVLPIVFKLN